MSTVPIDVTSASWALSVTRSILRDTTEPYDRADAELAMALDALAIEHDGASYYRPHASAAMLIRADPDRATQESIDNAQRSYRNPSAVATSILSEYAWIDARITLLTGVSVTQSSSFVSVF